MTQSRRAAAVALVLSGLLAACGSNGTPSSSGDDATAKYCDLARELQAVEGSPSDEQLDAVAAAAPAEIADDVDALVGAIREGTGQKFGEPEVEAAIERLEAFEKRECGITAPKD